MWLWNLLNKKSISVEKLRFTEAEKNNCPHIYVALIAGGSVVKNPPADEGNTGSTAGSGRPLGNPLQYYCVENPTDRGDWQATYSPWGHKKSDMTELLST